jgi:hypothetical protein
MLKKAGDFTPQKTGTSNPLGFIGQAQVTGGATAPDRTRVVLRTYSDAYEWDVPDGDVVKALTTGKPRLTPLPDEPQGEAIAYSRDGALFLTTYETVNLPGDELPEIRQYTPSAAAKPNQPPAATLPTKHNKLSWYQRMNLQQATSLIAAVGLVGVALVLAGVVGILRARRRVLAGRAEAGPSADAPTAVLSTVDSYGYEAGHPVQPGYDDRDYRGYP